MNFEVLKDTCCSSTCSTDPEKGKSQAFLQHYKQTELPISLLLKESPQFPVWLLSCFVLSYFWFFYQIVTKFYAVSYVSVLVFMICFEKMLLYVFICCNLLFRDIFSLEIFQATLLCTYLMSTGLDLPYAVISRRFSLATIFFLSCL